MTATKNRKGKERFSEEIIVRSMGQCLDDCLAGQLEGRMIGWLDDRMTATGNQKEATRFTEEVIVRSTGDCLDDRMSRWQDDWMAE